MFESTLLPLRPKFRCSCCRAFCPISILWFCLVLAPCSSLAASASVSLAVETFVPVGAATSDRSAGLGQQLAAALTLALSRNPEIDAVLLPDSGRDEDRSAIPSGALALLSAETPDFIVKATYHSEGDHLQILPRLLDSKTRSETRVAGVTFDRADPLRAIEETATRLLRALPLPQQEKSTGGGIPFRTLALNCFHVIGDGPMNYGLSELREVLAQTMAAAISRKGELAVVRPSDPNRLCFDFDSAVEALNELPVDGTLSGSIRASNNELVVSARLRGRDFSGSLELPLVSGLLEEYLQLQSRLVDVVTDFVFGPLTANQRWNGESLVALQGSPPALITEGLSQMRAGKVDLGALHFNLASANAEVTSSIHARALYHLAEARLRQGRAGEAEQALLGIPEGPHWAPAQQLLGDLYLRGKQNDQANEFFLKALNAPQPSSEAALKLAEVALLQDQVDEAFEYLSKWIGQDQDDFNKYLHASKLLETYDYGYHIGTIVELATSVEGDKQYQTAATVMPLVMLANAAMANAIYPRAEAAAQHAIVLLEGDGSPMAPIVRATAHYIWAHAILADDLLPSDGQLAGAIEKLDVAVEDVGRYAAKEGPLHDLFWSGDLQIMNPYFYLNALENLAELLVITGDYKQAQRSAETAVGVAFRAGLSPLVGQYLLVSAQVLAEERNLVDSAELQWELRRGMHDTRPWDFSLFESTVGAQRDQACDRPGTNRCLALREVLRLAAEVEDILVGGGEPGGSG